VYEYLGYSLIQQTIRIHLDAQCEHLASLEREAGHLGGLFEYMNNTGQMRARLLSAQLRLAMEETLFNCFGPQYTVDAKHLLSLHWLRSDTVQKNLQRVYGVQLTGS